MRWPTRICRVGVSFLPYPRGDRLDVDPLRLLGREPYEPEEFAWPEAFPWLDLVRLGAAFIVLIFLSYLLPNGSGWFGFGSRCLDAVMVFFVPSGFVVIICRDEPPQFSIPASTIPLT
jgi:hypothetical protein